MAVVVKEQEITVKEMKIIQIVPIVTVIKGKTIVAIHAKKMNGRIVQLVWVMFRGNVFEW